MKVKLLIATVDATYAGLISDNISEYHADIIDISVCSTLECLREILKKQKFDTALIDPILISGVDTTSIRMPLLLWSDNENTVSEIPQELGKINKHQRISSIVSAILEKYAPMSRQNYVSDSKSTSITAIWSPSGGVGKTAIALAYAFSNVPADSLQHENISIKKEVFYLNLENFSSIPSFFNKTGKSISSVFELLDNPEGNLKMLIQGICSREMGIMYLNKPDNYDDMNILTSANVGELVASCSNLADELVVDLSCACDTRTEKVFEAADRVFIVTEQSQSAGVKLKQFTSQNDVFERIKEKIVIVANKGAVINDSVFDHIISLPYVKSDDMAVVVRELSDNLRLNLMMKGN